MHPKCYEYAHDSERNNANNKDRFDKGVKHNGDNRTDTQNRDKADDG